jgi:Xaa-Pro aminopeptidase
MKDLVKGVSLQEYAQRRARLMKALNGAAAVVFAGEAGNPLLGKWRPESHFYYLTGLGNEAGAAVLFDPSAENPKRRIVLFLKPLNIEKERWDGYREEIASPLKSRTGFETVMRTDSLSLMLTGAARRTKKLCCLHAFSVFPAPVSQDLEAYRKVSERVPGVSITDGVNLVPSMRAIKSPAELGLMRRAVEITTQGFATMVKQIRPGVNEQAISRLLEQSYLNAGASGLAYGNIVGSGLNATVLHYHDNDQVLKKGDLMVVDSGCDYDNYASDVTRTYPVSGKYTSEQRDVYELVLAAQLAAIKASRAGSTMTEVDLAARNVIEKAGEGDAFIHSTGHQLGIQVHDATPDGPLKPGMVITIEPGLYYPARKLGVRIEDDILITSKGNEVLTRAIPKTVREVEAAMA